MLPPLRITVLAGVRLRVEGDDGATLMLGPGDSLVETVNTVHRGVSLGPEPAVVVVVYVGPKGTPTTIPVANPAPTSVR